MIRGSKRRTSHKGVARVQRVQHTVASSGSLQNRRYSRHDKEVTFRLIMNMVSMGHTSHKRVARVQRVQHTGTIFGSLQASEHSRVVSLKLALKGLIRPLRAL